jgi:hypothetical protein
MRTSTIRAIAPNGQWNGMDKHLVTMTDGVQYTFFVKSGEAFPKGLNEEVTFEVTNEAYKNAKLVGKTYDKPYQKTYDKPYIKPDFQGTPSTSKDDLIVRQTVIKAAAELHARSGNIDLVLQDAENMYNWINRK